MAYADHADDIKAGKQKQGQGAAVFEFTRRKRWSDTLISEAPDLAIFILSKSGSIWYAGPAVGELLGWKVGELIDKDVSLILNDEDLSDFREDLEQCASSSSTLVSYARLKCRPTDSLALNPQNELLFELRGNFVSDLRTDQKMFFILTAKPYPSRNMAIINTVLELKMEHEVLSQRLTILRTLKEQRNPGGSSKSSQSRAPSFTQLPKPQHSPSGFRHYNIGDVNGPDGSDEEEDPLRKNKRPFSPDHQFVCYTCGRTDSPEWRKGPTGPKTLCNACGLRWAKRAKKSNPKNSPSEESASSHNQRVNRKSVSTVNPPAAHPALSCTPPAAGMSSSSSSANPSGSVHSPSPLSASSLAAFMASPMVSQQPQLLSPHGFYLPPPNRMPQSQSMHGHGHGHGHGHASYSTLQHALAPESDQSSLLQPLYPTMGSWPGSSSGSSHNAYGY